VAEGGIAIKGITGEEFMTAEVERNTHMIAARTDRAALYNRDPRGLAFDLLFTAALFALLIFGLRAILPAVFGAQLPVVPAVIAALVPIVLTLLGSLFEWILPPAGPRKSLEKWLLHLQLTIFWFFAFTIVSFATLTGVTLAAHSVGWELGFIELKLSDGASWFMLILYAWLVAIVGDFFYYWYHRLMHKSHFFWQMHKLHHMDPELDATTWQRSNWPDTFASSILILLPFAIVFKVSSLNEWQLGAAGGTMIGVLKFFLMSGHANVRVQAGRMSMFWCTPQMHRIHHSYLPEHHDRNFAFVFPMWDVIFGTYYQPKRDEFPPTGVPGEIEITSFWEAQIFTLREWAKLFRQRRLDKANAQAGK
jgi:sterol desaturase/sphingolipid hydroxylase (fatty acid hydroxylase superfamily)